jgi:hypothetical protein
MDRFFLTLAFCLHRDLRRFVPKCATLHRRRLRCFDRFGQRLPGCLRGGSLFRRDVSGTYAKMGPAAGAKEFSMGCPGWQRHWRLACGALNHDTHRKQYGQGEVKMSSAWRRECGKGRSAIVNPTGSTTNTCTPGNGKSDSLAKIWGC